LNLLVRETEWILYVCCNTGPSKVCDVDLSTKPKTLVDGLKLLVQVPPFDPKLNLWTEVYGAVVELIAVIF
jgi:hypothetical protein